MKTGAITNTGVRIMSGVVRELSDRDRLVQAMNLRPSDDTIRRLAEFDLNAKMVSNVEARQEMDMFADRLRLSLVTKLQIRKQFILCKIRDADRNIQERLEELRTELRAERISYGELAELQFLSEHIDEGDTELLQWAGVPEN